MLGKKQHKLQTGSWLGIVNEEIQTTLLSLGKDIFIPELNYLLQ